jgi:hypothetical protein
MIRRKRADAAMLRIVRHHAEGLARVASVIDGSPDYDALLADRLDQGDRDAYAEDVPLTVRRARALAANADALVTPRRILELPWSGFVADGKTANNQREFAFMERICASLRPDLLSANYSDAKSIFASMTDPFPAFIRPHLLKEVEAFYARRQRITASLVHQQTTYTRAVLRYAWSFLTPVARWPGVLVQANDHSPRRVALSMVVKSAGVPRVYLQHAEVSPHFPPLEMEHAVLRNARSLATYRAIGPIDAETYVIPREDASPDLERLARDRGTGVDVVVYPTSRILAGPLVEVLSALRRNPHVARVSVKPHPGSVVSMEKLLDPNLAVGIEGGIPTHDHVAIVGNSSVSVELLAQGVPVYQCFALDAVAPDYYGLVARGLTAAVAPEALSGRFWAPYRIDDRWRAAFSEIVPDGEVAAHDRDRLVAAMAKLDRRVGAGRAR